MSADRELLELAAKAAGVEIDESGKPFKRIFDAKTQKFGEWQPVDAMPKSGSFLVCDVERGFVAPWVNGVIMNNPGTEYDWQYGSEISGWMPFPLPKAAEIGRGME